MRALAAIAVALTLWTPLPAHPTGPSVLVLDSNSPIKDSNRANHLLDLATRAAGVRMYQLTTFGMRPLSIFDVDGNAVPSQEVAPFSFQSSTNGVVSTVNEASEIPGCRPLSTQVALTAAADRGMKR